MKTLEGCQHLKNNEHKDIAIKMCNDMFDGSVFDYDDNERLKSERKKAKNRAIILVDYLIEDSKGSGYLGDHDKWLKVKKEIKNIRE